MSTEIRRCCHLDDDGCRCRATKDLTHMQYRGERVINGDKTAWVVIALCPKHMKPYL